MLSVAVIMNPGGIKDKSYNASVWAGVQKAVQKLHIDVEYFLPDKEIIETIKNTVEDDFDTIIIIPRVPIDDISDIIRENPETRFIVFDTTVKYDNVSTINFDNYQAGYLAGYIASRISENKTIGFLGADKTAMTTNLSKGFINGAKRETDDVEILSEYLSGPNSLTDENFIKEKVSALFSNGVDVIFTPTGFASLKVFELTMESEKLALGFDSNQDYYEEGYIVTSILRRLDRAVYEVLEDIVEDDTVKNEYNYDLEDNFIDYSIDSFSDIFLTPEFKKEIELVKDELKSEKVS